MWRYPPRSILAAVDFGDAAASALGVAGVLAGAFDAKLTAVHAETFEAPPYFTREQLDAIEKQRKAARREAAGYLARFAQQHAGRSVTPMVVEAPPADAILHAARGRDLIVMGTHGRRGAARWWAGSVAERVAGSAQVPVLVVRAGTPASPSLFKQVAVVTRTPSPDDAAMKYAKSLAAAFGGTLAGEFASCAAGPENLTLMVIGQGQGNKPTALCRQPLLFVPSI